MNIGFVALGKLGLPVALAVESKGHHVIGYDISKDVKSIVENRKIPYREVHAQEYLEKSNIEIADLTTLVRKSEIIFVSIQTPHAQKYEGITRIPDERCDFDYEYLKNGIRDLAKEVEKQKQDKIIVIISTVLPGTIRREIKPLLNQYVKLCYNPFFIAMGTTITDFLKPEMVLFGVDDQVAAKKAEDFYRTIHSAPFYKTTVENAELIKVLYNTFISTKIGFINTAMEMCHKLPNTDVDEITNALRLATDRIISDKYLRGGMGDGGGCHVRDNIALSWLSNKLNLCFDWFDATMKQRENHTEWLANLIIEKQKTCKLSIVILGKSFKEETNLTIGSPSVLLGNILKEKGIEVEYYDPYIDAKKEFKTAKLFFIGTKHPEFQIFNFPSGSVILDPWRYIPDSDQYELIPIGKHD